MLLASKTGNISAAKLLSETDNVWLLAVERREVRVSKADSHQRAFTAMSEALKWTGAESELIEHFVALEAAEAAPGNQVQS